ncbi:MAG: MoxR family ATPase [Ruminococcus sp.]|nr:MoxR family ATPase [Ruminococcus sp.]MBR4023625.1 MoxR family ATPase [Ruminococcus sp.]
MNNSVLALQNSINKVIVGKNDTINKIIIALLCEGHILLEDVPGVGKTQLVTSLSRSIGGKFNRIQLTPDIMPSDITGFTVIDQKNGEFIYREGAVMCNFLLADEINRASPKVQSSLLEAMEEYQISLDGVTHKLPKPFMVLATQNPVETYGTYHLPEAQMDRFFMKLTMGYPLEEEEIRILERTENGNPISNITEPAVSVEDIQALQQQVRSISVSDNIKKYIINLVSSTRQSPYVTLGISPRGSIALYRGAKACAFVFERSFVVPEDIKNIAVSVLAHRIILSQQGKNTFGTAEKYIQNLIDNTEIPV